MVKVLHNQKKGRKFAPQKPVGAIKKCFNSSVG